MKWNRRQFGLWTSASLLLPSVAVAGEPQTAQQAVIPPPPAKGLAAISMRLEFKSVAAHVLTYTVWAHNTGEKGLEVRYDLASADVAVKGESLVPVMAWLNDQHPLSRRVAIPDFVDLPADRSLAIAELHLELAAEDRKPGALLHTAMQVYAGEKRHRVEMPVIPLLPAEKQG